MSNLDSFVKSSRPPPESLATSQEITDRGSSFLGYIYRASTPEEARKAVTYLRNVVHANKRASHEMSAWRCMVLKPGRSGLGGPDDFELRTGSDDDSENWAGGKILKVMQAEGVIDAVVIVSRWYGGEMLGPVRFEHIETCAREVCHTFRLKDDIEECISTLQSLDDILHTLREELSLLKTSAPPTATPDAEATPQIAKSARKSQDYSTLKESLDLSKAQRLIRARENSIKSVKTTLKKAKEKPLPT